MSSRTYLSQRNAIPGFTFLLICLVFNYTPLLLVVESIPIQPLVGAVLGFVTILSGSAIGFHVTQLWWWWYQRRFGHYERKPYQTLIKKYKLTRCKDSESMKAVISVYGYVNHHLLGVQEKSELVKYCQRRWDLFHINSATITSILLGGFFGIGLRVMLHFLWAHLYVYTQEFYIHVILVIVCVVLIFLLRRGNTWILYQYDAVSEALILDKENNIDNLRDIFPKDYFHNN